MGVWLDKSISVIKINLLDDCFRCLEGNFRSLRSVVSEYSRTLISEIGKGLIE